MSTSANDLGLDNVGGVFVVLVGGMGISCIIAIFEFIWKSRKLAIEEHVSKHKYTLIFERYLEVPKQELVLNGF